MKQRILVQNQTQLPQIPVMVDSLSARTRKTWQNRYATHKSDILVRLVEDLRYLVERCGDLDARLRKLEFKIDLWLNQQKQSKLMTEKSGLKSPSDSL